MPTYNKITINPCLDPEPDIILEAILEGAESFHEVTRIYLDQSFGSKTPKFSDSQVLKSINLIKDYVLKGQCPSNWTLSDLGVEEFSSVLRLYSLFKITIDQYNYCLRDLSDEEEYFSAFVLSAISRFRLDASWVGEFLPYSPDGIDDVYFTKSEIAQLISVDDENPHVAAQIAKVLEFLKDENGETLADIESRIKKHSHPHKVIDAWKSKFRYSLPHEDFDTENQRIISQSILNERPLLRGYTKNRFSNKVINRVYPYKNAICITNLLAVKGFYKPSFQS